MTGRPDPIDSRTFTVDEYFAFEDAAPTRHDFFNGQVLDMAGGTTHHNSIAINAAGECRQALKGSPCRVYGSDQRLEVRRGTLYTYPDVQIVCGPPEYAASDRSKTLITNPCVVFEVLSPSTEMYDRIDKFRYYVALPSLADFILVGQQTPRVETYHRRDDGTWLFSWVEGLDAVLHVRSVDVRVPLAEIYRDVIFEPPEEPKPGRPVTSE